MVMDNVYGTLRVLDRAPLKPAAVMVCGLCLLGAPLSRPVNQAV